MRCSDCDMYSESRNSKIVMVAAWYSVEGKRAASGRPKYYEETTSMHTVF